MSSLLVVISLPGLMFWMMYFDACAMQVLILCVQGEMSGAFIRRRDFPVLGMLRNSTETRHF